MVNSATVRSPLPLPTSRAWNEERTTLQGMRREKDSAAHWDGRSRTYTAKDAPDAYVEEFLRLAGIHSGESVFDMGCGTGALSVPLGEKGHTVYAGDFSAGMLEVMNETLRARSIRTVFPKQMGWNDDWAKFGITSNAVDVCIASRSLAVDDMEDALLRLTDVARRRVCVTLSPDASPHSDMRILRELDAPYLPANDHLYAFNILAENGIKAEISYIESTRKDTFDTLEEACSKIETMMEKEAARIDRRETLAQALARLRPWLLDNLVSNENAGRPDEKGEPEKALRLAHPRKTVWAFLAWNK